jgi:hypothetical protein
MTRQHDCPRFVGVDRTRRVRAVARTIPLLAACLVLTGVAAIPAADAASVARPRLEVSAPASTATGEAITVVLQLRDAPLVAGYETFVRFDKTAAEFGGVFPGGERAPSDHVQTTIASEARSGIGFAVYSCSGRACPGDEVAAGSATQPLQTVEVRFAPRRPARIDFALDGTRFVDATGRPIEVDVPSRTFTVRSGKSDHGVAVPEARFTSARKDRSIVRPGRKALDLTRDGQVAVSDLSTTALAWETIRNESASCRDSGSNGDVNGDGCVDVADLQGVAATASVAAKVAVAPGDAGTPFVVDTTNDLPDWVSANGVCATVQGDCSLRAAIHEANAQPGPNTITFAIPGPGVHTIQLGEALPTVTDESGGLTIDGYTQPGSSPNTDPLVSDAVIDVEVRGGGHTNFAALTIVSAGNHVRGLAIYNGYHAVWLYQTGARDNVLEGNFLGTNSAGTFRAVETWDYGHGVYVSGGASHNQIGVPTIEGRNVISGNSYLGVRIDHTHSDLNMVRNNLFGLAPLGNRSIPNKMGIDIQWGASSSIVGGLNPLERNVFSGHSYTGVDLSHAQATTNNFVVGNFIGTTPDGESVADYTKTGYGIIFKDDAINNFVYKNVIGGARDDAVWHKHDYTGRNYVFDNRIGISNGGVPLPNARLGMYLQGHDHVVGPGNIITNNAGGGIRVVGSASDRNTITGNQIYGNGGQGIDLDPSGITANDTAGHTGPNNNANFPVLSFASVDQAVGTACAGCRVEVFRATPGGSGFGSGAALVGSDTADGSGIFNVAVSGVSAGEQVTTTATDASGNTSEFSPNQFVDGVAAVAECVAGAGTFLENGGTVVMEAEHFRTTDTGTGSGLGKYWVPDSTVGAVGQGALAASPNTGVNLALSPTGARLTYDVNFSTPGTYYVWVRGIGASANDDSVHVGLDGFATTTNSGSGLTGFSSGQFSWWGTSNGNSPTTVQVPTAGVHTVSIWMREDGVRIDRVVMSSSSNAVSNGSSAEGAVESDCSPANPSSPTPPPEPPGPPAPRPTFPDGALETVTVLGGPDWVPVPVSHTFVNPVAVCSVRQVTNPKPVVVRMRNVTATGFEIALVSPGDANPVASDLVDCIVAEEGAWTLPDGRSMEARRYDSSVTDTAASWVGQQQQYLQPYTLPAVIGQVMTSNDPGWSVFWARGADRTKPPNTNKLFTGKHVGEDPDQTRVDETVGYLVFESGHGSVGGVEYEAGRGGNQIAGVVNGGGSYTFATEFAVPVASAVVSQSGINGIDGSWAVTRDGASSSTLPLAVDEDTLHDTERSHPKEKVSYFAIAAPLAVSWSPLPARSATVFASDEFSRAIGDSWGYATVGGPYSMWPAPTGNRSFSVDGYHGRIAPKAGEFREAMLDSVVQADVDVSFRVKVAELPVDRDELFVVARRNSTDKSEYRLGVRIGSSGSLTARIIRVQKNVYTTLGTANLTAVAAAPDGYFDVRAQVSGAAPTSLKMKIWRDSVPEPGPWSLARTDSTAAMEGPGVLGIRVQLPATEPGSLFGFDDLLVTAVDP